MARGDKIYSERESLESEFLGTQLPIYSSKCKGVLTHMRDSHRLFGHEKSIGLLSNNQAHTGTLENVLRKATIMRKERAYIHHYEKFGVDADHFDEAFLNCENTLAHYQDL